MISYDQVRSSLEGYSPEQLGKLLGPALRGDVAMPQSGSRNEEPAEDFFVRLLTSKETTHAVRASIVRACQRLYLELLGVMQADSPTPASANDDAAFLRLCRLINMAKPAELRPWVFMVLQTQLFASNTRPEILGASVRAALAYPVDGEMKGMWNELLERPALAAYGFQALLSLPASRTRIVRELVRLWTRRLAHGWPTDAALLTLQASRRLADESLVDEVLANLRLDYPYLWSAVVTELQRRATTNKWLERLRLHQEPMRLGLISLLGMGSGYKPAEMLEPEDATESEPALRWADMTWDSVIWGPTRSEHSSHDPVGTVFLYHGSTKIDGVLRERLDEPAETCRIGTNVRLSNARWLAKDAGDSKIQAISPPRTWFGSDPLFSENEPVGANSHLFMNITYFGHSTRSLLSSPRQMIFPTMAELEETT